MSGVLILDTETRGLRPELGETAFAAATATPDLKGVRVYRLDKPADCELLVKALTEAETIIGHNIIFDLRQLIVTLGLDRSFFTGKGVIDTLLLAKHLLPGRGSYGLKQLTAALHDKLHHQDPKVWLKANVPKDKRHDYSLLPDEILVPYLVNDVVRTALLYRQLQPQIGAHRSKEQIALDHDLIHPVLHMQLSGVRVSASNLETLRVSNEALLAQWRGAIPFDFLKRTSIINQFGDVLLSLGFTTETGQPRADKESLKVLAERGVPLAEAMLKARGVHKLLSTYILPWRKFAERGRLHGSFNIFGTRTGRFSSSDPNLQNIPKDSTSLRSIMIPEEGHVFLVSDYSQQELRAVSYLSKDPNLAKALEGDVHSEAAKVLFKTENPSDMERKVAKTINFASLYGARARKIRSSLMRDTGRRWTLTECQAMLDAYWQRFAGVAAFALQCQRFAQLGVPMTDPMGRTQYPDRTRAYSMLNFQIQGFCAGVSKSAMKRVHAAGLDMRLAIHDEIVVMTRTDRVREEAAILKECMEGAVPGYHFPVEICVGPASWGGKIPLKDYLEAT